MYKRTGTGWTQQAKLIASDGLAGDFFGSSVSISGDYVIIGASGDDIGSNGNQGSAYIFKRSGTTWVQQTKLNALDGDAADEFGFSVSIKNNYAVVGSPNDNINANNDQGSSYIFFRSGTSWTQQDKLIATDGNTSDRFGNSCAIYGDNAVIGSFFDVIGGNVDQGSAYIFQRTGTTWAQKVKLISSDGKAGDVFGCSVAISNNSAIIGAFGNDSSPNSNTGFAYIFIQK